MNLKKTEIHKINSVFNGVKPLLAVFMLGGILLFYGIYLGDLFDEIAIYLLVPCLIFPFAWRLKIYSLYCKRVKDAKSLISRAVENNSTIFFYLRADGDIDLFLSTQEVRLVPVEFDALKRVDFIKLMVKT